MHVEFSADHRDMLAPRVDFTYPVNFTPDFATIVPQLPVEPGDIQITKRGWNAFYGTELDLQLRRRKVTGIVLAGIRTSVGVEGTTRAAYERGYNITFANDATSDYDSSAHEHSMTKILPRMGEIDTTQAIINFIKIIRLVYLLPELGNRVKLVRQWRRKAIYYRTVRARDHKSPTYPELTPG